MKDYEADQRLEAIAQRRSINATNDSDRHQKCLAAPRADSENFDRVETAKPAAPVLSCYTGFMVGRRKKQTIVASIISKRFKFQNSCPEKVTFGMMPGSLDETAINKAAPDNHRQNSTEKNDVVTRNPKCSTHCWKTK
uniref:Uncharacterized protein n=1 Tax=Romanomermis culicivorax TaxID=13658 RepID=A0A915IMF1_ROMCU